MKAGDLLTISPLIALTLTSVVVMLMAAFWRSHALALGITLGGLAATFGTLFVAASRAGRVVTPLVSMDAYTLFFIGLLTVATAIVALLSWSYLQQLRVRPEEYYVLLLIATLGGATLVASTHFASFFLGLEILSVSLYALIVYAVQREEAIEAAVKYLVLAGATSAFLIFGMALVYAESGTMSAGGVGELIAGLDSGDVVVTIGLVMLLVGVGFKLAVVPFHMWTPDVYEGAPAPVTAYVATVSKGAVFALLLRFMLPVSSDQGSTIFLALTAVAIASMVAGNLLALRQDNVKRILAYSSIAHLGYLLVAFLASGERAGVAVGFYLIAYFATTLAAFGVVTVLSPEDRDADRHRRLPRAGRATAVAGRHLRRRAVLAGRHAADDGVHRQVRDRRRRLRVGALGPRHRPRRHQHDRPLLLHPPDRGDVRAPARRCRAGRRPPDRGQ